MIPCKPIITHNKEIHKLWFIHSRAVNQAGRLRSGQNLGRAVKIGLGICQPVRGRWDQKPIYHRVISGRVSSVTYCGLGLMIESNSGHVGPSSKPGSFSILKIYFVTFYIKAEKKNTKLARRGYL